MIRTLTAGALLAVGTAAVACTSDPAEEPRPTGPSAAAVADARPTESLEPLVQRALPDVEGKTFTAAVVAFPPRARAVPHRHHGAFVYAYVLSGSVRSRLVGQPVHTYRQGDDWVEQPGAHHLLTENASATRPARLLVVFVSDTGASLKVDDRPAGSPEG